MNSLTVRMRAEKEAAAELEAQGKQVEAACRHHWERTRQTPISRASGSPQKLQCARGTKAFILPSLGRCGCTWSQRTRESDACSVTAPFIAKAINGRFNDNQRKINCVGILQFNRFLLD